MTVLDTAINQAGENDPRPGDELVLGACADGSVTWEGISMTDAQWEDCVDPYAYPRLVVTAGVDRPPDTRQLLLDVMVELHADGLDDELDRPVEALVAPDLADGTIAPDQLLIMVPNGRNNQAVRLAFVATDVDQAQRWAGWVADWVGELVDRARRLYGWDLRHYGSA